MNHPFEQAVLAWYDQYRRVLAWRHSEQPDPYKVWLSEMMLQQTTTMTVDRYYKKFIEEWPTIEDLAAATIDEVLHAWQGLGYYARARNLHRCARQVVLHFQGKFPANETDLKALPGIGAYTAAAILAIAFNQPAVVLDTNIIRILSRVFAITGLMKMGTPAFSILQEKAASVMSYARPGDYAQALMDIGATMCTAKTPKCLLCPLQSSCQAFHLGIQDTLPQKAPKIDRPVRHILFWVIFNKNNELAFVKRPEKGLLGGLMSLPLMFWEKEKGDPPFPLQGCWKNLSPIEHIFTHFTAKGHLYQIEEVDSNAFPADCWCEASLIHQLALPTIIKKALKNIFGQ
jgi:A/G-specific adenine glycosylase